MEGLSISSQFRIGRRFRNFVNRTIVLTNKYIQVLFPLNRELSAQDLSILEEYLEPEKIEELIMKYKLREAQAEMMFIARIGNKYLLIMSH